MRENNNSRREWIKKAQAKIEEYKEKSLKEEGFPAWDIIVHKKSKYFKDITELENLLKISKRKEEQKKLSKKIENLKIKVLGEKEKSYYLEVTKLSKYNDTISELEHEIKEFEDEIESDLDSYDYGD
jgi:hypothetical protein